MKMKERTSQMQTRQAYANVWHTELMDAVFADAPFCCFAMFCGPCASYMLRKRALYNNMSRYQCCAGYCPCSGSCGESSCPELCLCTEVLCCFTNSVASTRFLLQDEFNIQTTPCDNCIIGFMLCLNQLACICSLLACLVGSDEIEDLAELLGCLSDLVFCSVCPCMQTQHKLEMDKRDGKFGQPPMMAAPGIQQMSRIDQLLPPQVCYPPVPPPVGYPPHQVGYPPSGYPPQQQVYYPPGPGYVPPPYGQQPPMPPPQGYAYNGYNAGAMPPPPPPPPPPPYPSK